MVLDDTLIELSQREILGLAFLFLLFVISIGISRMPQNNDPEKIPPLMELQRHVGLQKINTGLFLVALVFWGIIFALLFCGLVLVIWTFILATVPNTSIPEEIWDWRFSLVKLTALTATMGAVVALPFTLIRLTHSRRQTQTAKEALFNNKIDAAVSDLHAQRQVTRWIGDDASNGWEDDVTRRNGAINRLEGLAGEDPNAAPRIARMLSVYLREVSQQAPIELSPKTDDTEALLSWSKQLAPTRSDTQNAAQTLGRLISLRDASVDLGDIDLTRTNLQGFDLSILDFNNANFEEAMLEGTDFFGANLSGAFFRDVQLCGAKLRHINAKSAVFYAAALQGVDFFEANL